MLLSSPLFSHLSLRVSGSLLPAARLLQTPIPTPVSPYDSFSQHPSSPASCILASQAPRVSSPSSAVPGLPGPKSKARQSGIRQMNRRSGCGPTPVSMVRRPSCQCGGGSSRASPSTAEQCPRTPAPAGGGISPVTIIHGDQALCTAAGSPPIPASRRWRGGVS